MKNYQITRRTLLGTGAGAIALGATPFARALKPPAMPPIISEPIFLTGRLIKPIREVPVSMPIMFQGERVTGYTNFRVEENDVLRKFVRENAATPFVRMECRIKNSPDSNYLTVEPIALEPSREQPLPDWRSTPDQEGLTTDEENALTEMMRLFSIAVLANPDSIAAEEMLQQYIAAFTRLEEEPSHSQEGIRIPYIISFDKGNPDLSFGSIYDYVEQEAYADLTACIVTLLKTILLILVQFIVGAVLRAQVVQEIGRQAQRLFNNVAIRNAIVAIIDVFRARGLRGDARGRAFEAALRGLIAAAGREFGTSLVAVIRQLPWYLVCSAVASALLFIAKIAGVVATIWSAIEAISEIVKNCNFRPDGEDRMVLALI